MHDRTSRWSGRDVCASHALVLHRTLDGTTDRTTDRPEQCGRLLRPSST
ncbi:hypothetical protein OMK64_17420 [Cellulomonas fimi]|nr:hypothetical protein [Cellulomonas fimi]MDC7123312.1 hypothetical protein [Cellulomonas fimi]